MLASSTCSRQVRLAQFLERGAKRRDELFGQIRDEADGIGDSNGHLRREVGTADGRIERREGAVGDVCVAPSQNVEQRRLADVGVPDQRDERFAMRTGPPQASLTLNLAQRGVAA